MSKLPSRIFWFAYFNEREPSVRYRGLYPLLQIRAEAGIPVSLFLPERSAAGLLRFARIYLRAMLFAGPDAVIVFQKIYTGGWYAHALRLLLCMRRSQSCYDIDDAEYLRHDPGTVDWFMSNASLCLAGSSSLVEYAKQRAGRPFLLGSSIIAHKAAAEPDVSRRILGWIGYYRAHRDSLMQLLFPAIRAAGRPVTLEILGLQSEAERLDLIELFRDSPHISISAPLDIDWLDEAAVYERIGQWYAGAAPLLDTPFNRAKSAFKLKQCLSCGVPVLASPVGENVRYLEPGKNGYRCSSEAEFRTALQELLDMPAADYARMRARALASSQAFSMDIYCRDLLQAFTFVLPEGQGQPADCGPVL